MGGYIPILLMEEIKRQSIHSYTPGGGKQELQCPRTLTGQHWERVEGCEPASSVQNLGAPP